MSFLGEYDSDIFCSRKNIFTLNASADFLCDKHIVTF